MKFFIGEPSTCALNYQDIVIIEELMKYFEMTQDVKEADIIVFTSSCCCTENMIHYTLNYIENCVKEKKPDAKVYLTGCITRTFKSKNLQAWITNWFQEHIDYVIPQNHPLLLLQKISDKFLHYNTNDFGCSLIDKEENKARLYIGNGCQNNCAFCKTAYQYYPLKSIPINEVKEKIDYANSLGISQIQLTATNVCQYGLDLYSEPRLPELIEYIESKKNIQQIHFIGFAFQDAIKYQFQKILLESKKADYISGSLETGSPHLLEMIRKGFTPEEFLHFIDYSRQKYQKQFNLSIISGLPTENLEDIRATLDILMHVKPCAVQICEYSGSRMLPLSKQVQLTREEMREHTRIYEKVLTRKKIPNRIV